MKSLAESIFDDNTRDYTFGDLFELESYNIVKNVTARSTYQDLTKTFSVGRIKKVSHISGIDKNESIYRGLVKIISDIKLTGDPDDWYREQLRATVEDKVSEFFQHSSSTLMIVYVGFDTSNGALLLGTPSIFNPRVGKIHMSLGPDLSLVFRRK
jgi:hypothetical protein